MNKDTLIDELRFSLPSSRMLEVVNIGAVKVGEELIIIKQRPNFELKEEEAIVYKQQRGHNHHYKEILAKTVIFDHSLLNARGRNAIIKYLFKREN